MVEKSSILPLIAQFNEAYEFEEIVPISASDARTKEGIRNNSKSASEGDMYYPEDMLTDQHEVLAEELIREKLLHLLSDECLMVWR